jgi:signal transduction histidine kinase
MQLSKRSYFDFVFFGPFIRYGLVITALVAAVIVFFPGALHGMFRADEFMPHATCYLRNPKMILLHVSSDLAIGFSYVCISTTLGYLVYRASRDIPFHWMFLAFGLFIVTCGMTHFMEVWTVWKPLYWLAGYVKVICAAASVTTAIALFPLVPRIFALINSVKVSEQRRQQLQTAYGEMESFTYSVSHDLRAPLRAVLGMARVLEEDHGSKLDADAKAYLERIRAASDKMDGLIRDMLEYSKVTRADIALVPVSVRSALAEAKAALSADFEKSGAVLEESTPLPWVTGNARLLTQVLVNLLGNAIKFTRPGEKPRVTIAAQEYGNLVRIAVTDNGIGIAPEYQQQIFKMFERLHSASEYPGTGIGLAIAQKAMERMNGRVGLESASGEGSTFWIELPKAGDAQTARSDSAGASLF